MSGDADLNPEHKDHPFVLPYTEHTARDLHFEPDHEYVSAACVHRQHDSCEALCLRACPFCSVRCLCVCHRWRIAVEGA